ncbi:haloacid dehalogenase-like hydrolase [Nitzschia inconspicua]|uniref:Haloacid dehalogenase-like hydrolase n=1 Tax=Nitzschia inconspicua TaxID=303405 RepID=A0A9K3LP82_9STRA|nr:haloacid dehalogenase-like hydrolase [Nitzschia inconspicua]
MVEHPDDGVKDISLVFSDLDGTLLHYPTKILKGENGNQLLKLPPSSTGMRGVISSKTHSIIQEIRRTKDVKFVLVSGMRTSTFLNRLPFLPKADAYCTEAGGRIFYPTTDVDQSDAFVVKPKPFDGAMPEDLIPFGIIEDPEWRSRQEQVAGPYDSPDLKELAKNPSLVKPLKERDGLLWDFARDLVHKGYVLDTKGYSACFRVNRKQQDTISDSEFDALLDGRIKPFEGLASSINLSCVDYYPATSGKKHCCLYLAERFFPDSKGGPTKFVKEHSVCLCDDDNDLEMAEACGHAYIPEISSQSMKEIIGRYPDHFTQTGGEGMELQGHESTEAALLLVSKRLVDKETNELDSTVATSEGG